MTSSVEPGGFRYLNNHFLVGTVLLQRKKMLGRLLSEWEGKATDDAKGRTRL